MKRKITWGVLLLIGVVIAALLSPVTGATASSRPVTADVPVLSQTLNASAVNAALSDGDKSSLDDMLEPFARMSPTAFDGLVVGKVYPVTLNGRTVSAQFVYGHKYPAGPGHRSGPVWSGLWKFGGKFYLCINFSLHAPDGSSSTVVGTITELPRETAKRVIKIANRASSAGQRNNLAADCNSWANWRTIGGKPVKTYFAWLQHGRVSKKVVNCSDRVMTWSKQHGPYKLKVAAQSVLPGKSGHAVATLTNNKGNAVAGQTVKFSAVSSNLRFTDGSGKTNTAGKAKGTYRVTGSGVVSGKACYTDHSSAKALLTNPSGNNQRLAGGGFTDVVCAKFSFQKKLAPKITKVCDTNCLGVATVTAKQCVPKGAGTYRMRAVLGNSTRYLAVKPGSCETLTTKKAPDGSVIKYYLCEATKSGGKCTGKWRLSATYTVVCPAWIFASASIDCNCERTDVGDYNFPVPAGAIRDYEALVKITATGEVLRFRLKAGSDNPITLPARAAGHVQLGFAAYLSPNWAEGDSPIATKWFPAGDTVN